MTVCVCAFVRQCQSASHLTLPLTERPPFVILKILMDLYTIYAFIKRMKMQQPSSPLVYLSSYITLLIYFLGLFLYTNKLPENIGINQILLLAVYVVSDWLLLLFSWTIQLNIVARRDELFRFKANKIEIEKK